jgi:hypothetical protein
MQWEFIVALIIAIPLILFPAAFIWYLNVGGIYQVVKRLVARRAARAPEQATKTVPESNRTGE